MAKFTEGPYNESQDRWIAGLTGGRRSEFPRWREVTPGGAWSDWWDEEGLWGCVESHWPDDDGQIEAGEHSRS